MKELTEVNTSKINYCEVCANWGFPKVIAIYDAKTTHQGKWAFLCKEHFEQFGIGLGLGKGQKLIQL